MNEDDTLLVVTSLQSTVMKESESVITVINLIESNNLIASINYVQMNDVVFRLFSERLN